jgi:hypothetical protein
MSVRSPDREAIGKTPDPNWRSRAVAEKTSGATAEAGGSPKAKSGGRRGVARSAGGRPLVAGLRDPNQFVWVLLEQVNRACTAWLLKRGILNREGA